MDQNRMTISGFDREKIILLSNQTFSIALVLCWSFFGWGIIFRPPQNKRSRSKLEATCETIQTNGTLAATVTI